MDLNFNWLVGKEDIIANRDDTAENITELTTAELAETNTLIASIIEMAESVNSQPYKKWVKWGVDVVKIAESSDHRKITLKKNLQYQSPSLSYNDRFAFYPESALLTCINIKEEKFEQAEALEILRRRFKAIEAWINITD